MQRRLLILLLGCAVFFTACSYSMEYIVVNESENPIIVTYIIGGIGEPLAATGMGVPAMCALSEIAERENWRTLTSTELVLDSPNRTVTVSLPPHQGLLIHRGAEWRSGRDPAHFIIKEIRVAGLNGEMILQGDQVYKGFVPGPKPFFGPPGHATLTYK